MRTQIIGLRKQKQSYAAGGKLSAVGQMEHRLAKANTLLLDAVEQPARPHKLGGKNAKCQDDGEGPWTRSNDHYDTQHEKGEAD
jgi:hypothetical protein